MRLICLLLAGAIAARAVTPETPAIEQLRVQIQKTLEKYHTPGAAIAVVRRDGPEWVAGVGLANVATKTPATADTLFRIGSTSKAFVSLSLLKLQREGKLRLDDTLASRAPDLVFSNPWESTDPVRIVNLVEHTTGWNDMSLSEYAYPAPDSLRLREGLAFHPTTRTSRWRPGTRFAYSNEGPPAAAYIVERITGRRFEDYVTDTWFRPIGMATASYFEPTADVPHAELYRPDGKTPYPYWHILLRPAGSINASARDMAAYVQFYLDRGTVHGVPLLPAEDIVRAETPTSTLAAREGLESGYGMGNYTSIYDGWVFHGHNGGMMGGVTDMAYLPDAGVGYAVMINTASGRALNEIARAIRQHITHGLTKPTPTPASPAGLSSAVGFQGWYEPASPRVQLGYGVERIIGMRTVRLDAKRLTVRTFAGRITDRRYVNTTGRLFRVTSDPVATLALIGNQTDGHLIQFAMGGTFRRIPAWVAYVRYATLLITPVLMLSTVVFAFVWGIRLAAGYAVSMPKLNVRILPLAASLCFVLLLVVSSVAGAEVFDRLGHPSVWSLSIYGLSIAFPVLAFAGLAQAWRWRRAGIHPVAWWHSLLCSGVLSIVGVYFCLNGLFALRTWA